MHALIFASLTAATLASENPPPLTVRSVSTQGVSCPAGSQATAFFRPDSQQLELDFPELSVTLDPGMPAHLSRGHCHMTFDIEVPKGWQYAVQNYKFWGEIKIPAGWTGTVDVQPGFAGGSPGKKGSNVFPGKRSDAVDAANVFAPIDQVWSSCKEPTPLRLSFLQRLQKNPGTPMDNAAYGYMSFHPYFFPGKIGLVLRRCPESQVF